MIKKLFKRKTNRDRLYDAGYEDSVIFENPD